MLQLYINKLIENLPDSVKNVKKPLKLDLILGGGVFNGSFLIGALHFLKEMEKRKYIKVCRISGCSIGSLAGLLYFSGCVGFDEFIYDVMRANLNKKHNLDMLLKLPELLKERVPDNVLALVNNRLFISYNNLSSGTKATKSTYKTHAKLIDTVIRSCYVPFVIDGDILYKNKYMDGITPYIFGVKRERKVLYLNVLSYKNILQSINIKNEKSNTHRVLSGLIDIHSFYIKQTSSDMCSYVNDWSTTDKLFNVFTILLERIIIQSIGLVVLIRSCMTCDFNETVVGKLFIHFYKYLLNKYFL